MSAPQIFLDAHVHHWDPRTTPRAVSMLVKLLGFSPGLAHWAARTVFPADALAFYGTPDHILNAYLPADHLADAGGVIDVAGWVHVDAGWEAKGPLGPVEETRWVDALPGVDGRGVAGIVAQVDLTLGDELAPVLDAHQAASTRLRGVRDLVGWHPSDSVMNLTGSPERMRSSSFRAGFARLADRGLSFETTCYSEQLGELAELARAHPEQTIILCHLGTPAAVGGPVGDVGATPADRERIRGRWEEGLAVLSECPNTFVKLSGVAMPVLGFGFDGGSQPPSVAQAVEAFGPLVHAVVDRFGAERCMFGSNFPVDKASLPLPTLLGAFRALTDGLGPDASAHLFCGTAARVYRLSIPQSSEQAP